MQLRSKPLSALFADPFLKAAFERAERDQGDAAAAAINPTPDLNGDDAVALPVARRIVRVKVVAQ
jgi:hypothetical protein